MIIKDIITIIKNSNTARTIKDLKSGDFISRSSFAKELDEEMKEKMEGDKLAVKEAIAALTNGIKVLKEEEKLSTEGLYILGSMEVNINTIKQIVVE